MKPCIPEAKDFSSPSKKNPSTPTKQEKTQPKKQRHPFMILPEKDDIEQESSKQGKFCMAHLCKSFLQKHSSQGEHIFESGELLKDFKVKQRRLYDLMNILQGSGCVLKLSKGKYKWKGLQQTSFPLADQKPDLTSLRHISSNLKQILYQSQIPLSFSQLNNLLVAQKNLNQINPTSIRRRTYQCCKVFTILGYITKIGKQYSWAKSKDREGEDVCTQKRETLQKNRLHKIQLKCQQKKLTNDILKKYKAIQQIEQFFQRVKQQYLKRQTNQTQISNNFVKVEAHE